MKIFSKVCAVALAVAQTSVYAHYDESYDNHMNDTHSFTGFDVAIGIGVSSLTMERDHDKGNNTGDLTYGADGVAVQLKVGGNYEFYDSFVAGLEFYAQYNSAESYNRYILSEFVESDIKRTFSMPWNLALDARIGVCPTKNSLVFLYGGPDWGYYDFHLEETVDSIDYKFTNFEIGGVFGAGLQQAFCENWFLKMTVDYRWYTTKTLTISNGDIHEITPRLTTGLLMLGYQF